MGNEHKVTYMYSSETLFDPNACGALTEGHSSLRRTQYIDTDTLEGTGV